MFLREIDRLVQSDLKEIGEFDEKIRLFNPTINRLAFFESRIKGLDLAIPLTETELAYVEELENLNTYLKKPNSNQLRNYNIPVRYNGKHKLFLSANFTSPTEPVLSYTPESDPLFIKLGGQKIAQYLLEIEKRAVANNVSPCDRTDNVSFYHSVVRESDGVDRFYISFRTHKDDVDFIGTVPNLLIKDYLYISYSEPIKIDRGEIREDYNDFIQLLKSVSKNNVDSKSRINPGIVSVVKNAYDFWFSVIKSYTPHHYKNDLRCQISDSLSKRKIQ